MNLYGKVFKRIKVISYWEIKFSAKELEKKFYDIV